MLEYEVNKELSNALKDLLDDDSMTEFTNIREHEVIILPCMKIKTDKDGESQESPGEVVQMKKVSPLHRVFIEAHYIMVVDYYGWTHAKSTDHQKAMLHKALMRVEVDKDDGGNLKFSARAPDVVEFRATVVRFGAYTEPLLDMREAFKLAVPTFVDNTGSSAKKKSA